MFPEAAPRLFHQYKVNVLVDRKNTIGAPVIFESNPTYQNVFGHIEKKPQMGGMTTDFTMVKAGSLLQADGGFLIMEIDSLLMNLDCLGVLEEGPAQQTSFYRGHAWRTRYGGVFASSSSDSHRCERSFYSEAMSRFRRFRTLTQNSTKHSRFGPISTTRSNGRTRPSSSMHSLWPGFARRKHCFPFLRMVLRHWWNSVKNTHPTSKSYP